MQCRMKLHFEDNRMCGKYLWKCKKCGNAGCDNRDCKNQAFESTNGMCLACNQTSARVTL